MAFNGSGVFLRLYNWVSDRNAAIKIRADRMDGEMDGFATGLSNCITKDGQTTVTQDIPFNNKRLTGVADATADSDALNRQAADARYPQLAATDARYPQLAATDARYQQATGLAASVGSSALTISLKTISGNDPSASDSVVIPFRSATAATGTITRRTVTAATSLVISSGSTMGFTSAVAGRIWIVAFDDAGTVRLGAINCRSGTNITPLSVTGVASSTAEGGAGAADSAGVFYTATAVASKAYTVLGYMEWGVGLTTAGAWVASPTTITPFHAGMKLPGDRVQRVSDRYTTNAALSTALPLDDTIPTSTEGTQVLAASITPLSAANLIEARYKGQISANGTAYVGSALFDGGAAAVAVDLGICNTSNDVAKGAIDHTQIAGGTSAQAWTVRVGAAGGFNAYMNGISSTRYYGGVSAATLIVEEIQS